MIIDDPVLAGPIAVVSGDHLQPDDRWRVTLDGDPIWTSRAGALDRQPARSTGQRRHDGLSSLLPLEDRL